MLEIKVNSDEVVFFLKARALRTLPTKVTFRLPLIYKYSIITYGYFHGRSHIITVLTCESRYFTDSSCMEVAWSWILFLMYSCSYILARCAFPVARSKAGLLLYIS